MSEPNAEAEEPDDAESTTSGEPEEIDDLAARVAVHDEGLAAEVEKRGERIAELEAELDELTAEIEELEAETEELEERLKRERADFQNYKKRAEKREEQLRQQATADLVERLLDVRDNLVRALEQDDDADIADGVEATLSSFDSVLDGEGVEVIDPEPGEETDPHVHEVMMRVDGDQPADTIEEVYRPGYRMGEKVLRTAQVTVSEGNDDDGGASEGDEDAGSDGDDGTDPEN